MKKDSKFIYIVIFVFIAYLIISHMGKNATTASIYSSNTFYILSSYENKVAEQKVVDYAKKLNKKVEFKYLGDLDIVDELNNNSKHYDAVWISNSMWLYMLNNSYLTTDSKSISISPVVFGVRKSKAKELGLTDNNVTNTDMVNLIKEKKIKYVMPSVTRTNSGATAYLGFLQSLSGNPEVLTEEMINTEEVKNNLKDLFSGVERVSGDESYLESMFLNDSSYDAVIASESSLININKKLVKDKKEPLYLIYPTDGVAINDSTFAFINNDSAKEDLFLKLQSYLLSDKGKKMLEENGVRTWYGGVTTNSNEKVFKKEWGIDTTKYLNVTKFPSKKVIDSAIDLYIEKLRKPTHVVFCLDYSGSMYGEGEEQLEKAMEYILTEEQAKKDKLQFSENDKITIITFGTKVTNVWSTDNGKETSELLENIEKNEPDGGTALYAAIIKGLKTLNKESDEYTTTIIAMTDGAVNIGEFSDLKRAYKKSAKKIPIYSITFGQAEEEELEQIAKLSNAKVFDGKTDLLKAFKEVRGYN